MQLRKEHLRKRQHVRGLPHWICRLVHVCALAGESLDACADANDVQDEIY